ncbi:MAG: hypothetical protein US60_C0004G0036 [Microgenomates group bacterium GW2011_GWC1_37_8]|uniref:Glycosyl transferase group 1 n=1 Tax=Candidatus Woesebacteria bacterium GW2011_GWB1_38_8 TaxID=1618570 RepID=A0A0G0L177_9BACT|nr:MAG: hypothetical protein US60_C0004G0036 [Microgenomates group bacterium GW2011_GWC1_37_8]KKQ85698.1 MAG: Glycosyl transferase group 1 [Candidatus Woesebacteria bacterium GW2011_GWB1_38_8]
MNVALVYDRVNKWGGAEKVLLALHEIFPDAPLYTSVYSPEKAPWAKVFPNVVPSFLNRIPTLNYKHELLAPLMPLAFETFNLDKYDLVISVTSEAAKGVITKPATLHICYCLTPTRYLWSHYDEYFKGRTFKDVTNPIVTYLRTWDKIAAQRPDVMIGISTAVEGRIKKFYGRESELIHPPVDTKKFEIWNTRYEKTKPSYHLPSTSYYLIVSRLVPYKKVDLIIEAFIELGYPLVVVGTGSEEKKYKTKYKFKKNIIFKGFVSDKDLISLYQGAKAFIHPQEEDFGITAVEAQAAGIPVIAYKKGGALDTVIDGKTGVFFKEQTIESLIKAVKYYDDSNQHREMRRSCINNAQKFSKERFIKEFKALVDKNIVAKNH